VETHHTQIVNAEAIQLVRDYMVDPEHHMAHPKRYHYGRLTDRVGDTVTVPLGMGHMVFRVDHIVSNQLYGFGLP
jgi:hypothetical protein